MNMHQEERIRVKFSEGLGIFDQHYGSPQIDEQEIYDGPTGKVIDIQGIQAHAGRNFFVPEGKEFSFDIDECPYLHIEIKAEPGTNTCLFLLVHERKHDWNRRFVVIGKTPQDDCQRHLMSNYFTIRDDNKWHEYVYDLRTIREEKDDNIYHQPICQDAGSIREIQFYSWTGPGTHTFHFNKIRPVPKADPYNKNSWMKAKRSEQSLDSVIARLAMMPPLRLKRRIATDRAALVEHREKREEIEQRPFQIRVKKGEIPPVEVNLNMRFVTSGDEQIGRITDWPLGIRRRGIAAISEGLSQEDLKKIRKMEPELLKWIAESDKNAARFYVDPLSALDLAGIKIDPQLQKKIRQVRKRSMEISSSLPRAHIKSIKIGSKPK
jgi:hypothetical protein